jgi:hypothetical protein
MDLVVLFIFLLINGLNSFHYNQGSKSLQFDKVEEIDFLRELLEGSKVLETDSGLSVLDTPDILTLVVKDNKYDLVKFVLQHNCKHTKDALKWAVRNDNRDIFLLLAKYRVPFDFKDIYEELEIKDQIIKNTNRRIENFQFFVGFMSFNIPALNRDFETIKWLLDNGTPVVEDISAHYVTKGDLDKMIWLIERNFVPSYYPFALKQVILNNSSRKSLNEDEKALVDEMVAKLKGYKFRSEPKMFYKVIGNDQVLKVLKILQSKR